MKAATAWQRLRHAPVLFQSTPPVKAATLPFVGDMKQQRISIHAAREGGDAGVYDDNCPDLISIHAAREGGDYKADYSKA